MENDVNDVEETSPGESSTTEQTVPYSRFKEVNERAKELEQQLETVKPQTAKTKEEQAEEYLAKLTEKVLTQREQAQKEAEIKEQKQFESEVNDILSIHTDVKKDEFLKFIEDNGDKYGVTSVKGAMLLYKDLNDIKTKTAEETKDSLNRKPGLPKSEGIPYTMKGNPDDRGKTLEQIKEEAIAELEAKGQK